MGDIFEYRNYKEFLREVILLSAVKGIQSKLAAAAKCQRTYFSRVQKGEANLSLEQASGIGRYLRLNPLEANFFLDLVLLARTSDRALQSQLEARLDQQRDERSNLKKRLIPTATLEENGQAIYYSSWHWSAIHVLVSIPGFRTIPEIAARLSLPEFVVRETLERLRGFGLVDTEHGVWRYASGQIHLPRDSMLSGMNHANWRHRAVLDVQKFDRESVHYSVVQSHSFVVYDQIKQLLLQTVEQSRKMVGPSADEELTGLCIDFFRV